MIREAKAGDEQAILDFVKPHISSSMFIASNLQGYGLFNRTDPHGTTFWLSEKNGALEGVFAVTNNGYLMAQWPSAGAADWTEFARVLHGRSIVGMTGVEEQVDAAIASLNLPESAISLRRNDPLFDLELTGLRSEDQTRQPCETDVPMLLTWWQDYMAATGQALKTEEATKAETERRTKSAIEGGLVRLLLVDGQAVAMTNINARFQDIIQIGGVYVPPDQRGQGFAGRVVKAQLAELAQQGDRKAILFAASEDAAKAYTRIGFQLIGNYRMVLLKAPTSIGDAA